LSVRDERLSLLKKLEGLPVKLVDLLAIVVISPDSLSVEVSEKEHKITYKFHDYHVTYEEASVLVKRRLLRRVTVDRLTRCPNCMSRRVRLRFHCPHCGSLDVEYTRVVQHVLCSYVDLEVKFYDEEKGEYRCPNCGLKVNRETDLVEVGRSFYCFTCGKVFSRPVEKFFCENCNTVTGLREILYLPVYGLRATDESKRIVEEAVDMTYAAAKALDSAGIKEYRLYHVFTRQAPSAPVTIRVEDKCIDMVNKLDHGLAITLTAKKDALADYCTGGYYIVAREIDYVAEGILAITGVQYARASLPSEAAKRVIEFVLTPLESGGVTASAHGT